MPHHKSCKKRLITNRKARIANRAAKTQMRHGLRAFREIEDAAQAAAKLPGMSSLLDRLAKRGIIKRDKADRLKSRLALRVNSLDRG